MQPDSINLWYFKPKLFWSNRFKNLWHCVVKIKGLKYSSLCCELSSFWKLSSKIIILYKSALRAVTISYWKIQKFLGVIQLIKRKYKDDNHFHFLNVIPVTVTAVYSNTNM